MVKKNYKMKKTISMKQFITELGVEFSSPVKERLLELGERCLLNRRDDTHILDLRHIEHLKYECSGSEEEKNNTASKEYAYGQLIVKDGVLHFSRSCIENDTIMQIPLVEEIYDCLKEEEVLVDDHISAKRLDETNIDYVIDRILGVCPAVSPEHMAIIAKYSSMESTPVKNTKRY